MLDQVSHMLFFRQHKTQTNFAVLLVPKGGVYDIDINP